MRLIFNDLTMAKFFIEKGADVHAKDNEGNTPLHGAKKSDLATMLIEKGADVNAKNEYGESPLHRARTPAIAKLLIDHGADKQAKNNRGEATPYHLVEPNTNLEAENYTDEISIYFYCSEIQAEDSLACFKKWWRE